MLEKNDSICLRVGGQSIGESRMKGFDRKKIFSQTAFIVVLVLFIGIAALYLYNIINWRTFPDFGYGFRSATGIRVVGVVTEHGRKAGLQIGDRFIEVNSESFKDIEEFRKHMRRKLGEENTYLIERKGRRFAVTIKNVQIGFKRVFSVSGYPYLVGLCYALIGTIVFLMKPYQRSSWVFFLLTLTFGLFFTFLYKLSVLQPVWLENLNIFTYTFTPAALIHLALAFPQEHKLINKQPYIQFFPYVIAAILFILIRNDAPSMWDASRHLIYGTVAYMAMGAIFFMGSCVLLWLTSLSEIVKLRSKMILLGSAITLLVPVLDFVSNAFFQVYILPSFNYYLPFFIAFPAFVGYSIVKHDLFDIDAIIKRTYGYVLTTGAIAGIYGLFVLISNLAFGSYEFSKSPVFPLIFILAVVFLFNPIRNRVQKFIDRVFYRLEYDYQETVQRISESMRTLLGLDKIGKSIMDTALGTMFIDAGSVLLLNPDKQSYECLIQAGRREDRRSKTEIEAAISMNKSNAAATMDMAGEVSGEAEAFVVEACELTLAAEEPLVQKIAQKKKEITIYDIQEDPLFEAERAACEKTFEQWGATLIIPLIYEDQLTGMIFLGRKKSGKFYRREDINLLNILANQGAVAIENAQMVDEVIEKERMEEELNIARDLQVSMLPAETPRIEGFEIAAFSESAREVGGDFYDFIEMGAAKAGMVIGDVTGKSVSGALVMSASRSVFRMLSEQELTVADSMMHANRRLKKDIITGMFVALLYAIFDSRDKTLTLCSAGQTQPIHVAAKTGEAILVETKGDTFPLGILDDSNYEDTQLALETGDKVILYTDGIVEAMNEQEEIYGFDRLLDVVKNSQTMTAETLLEEIKRQVNEFAGDTPQHDDITIIVVQATE